MSSLRGAYKAQLREGSSLGNRRRSKGVERKSRRDEEVRKRRNLSEDNDMSPIVERSSQVAGREKKKGSKGAKADTVLERLKLWRNEKKRQQEQMKQVAKSKPMFKVGALVRDTEAELFKASTNKSKDKAKDAEKKVPPPKKQPVKAKEPTSLVTRGSRLQKATKSSADLSSKHSFTRTAKVPTPKKSLSKAKELTAPKTKAPNLKKSATCVDLASKLTAAAAAKRNTVASPKKFLRATRATTLQKKEPTDVKRGGKTLKGSSKSTGNLLTKTRKSNKTETVLEVDSIPMVSSYNLVESSSAGEVTSVIPNEVPQILDDFNFSAMASSSSDSATDSKAESSENNMSFAGLKLKSRRKSTRKSVRLVNPDNATNNPGESSDDNLMTFTPCLSKRKSVYVAPLAPVNEALNTDQNEVSSVKVSATPKSTKRKSIGKSLVFDSLLAQSSEEESVENGNLSISVSPKSGRRSVQKLAPDWIDDAPVVKIRATPKSTKRQSTRRSMRIAAQTFMENETLQSPDKQVSLSMTPKSGKRKSKYGLKVLGSTASKQFVEMHISGLNDSSSLAHSASVSDLVNSQILPSGSALNVPKTPLTSSSKRKNVRKSLSLQAALALVQSEVGLNSGSELSQEVDMDVDSTKGVASDVDTQVHLVDVTSTPKVFTSVEGKRKSLKAQLMISNIEDISPDELPLSSPKLSRSVKRRSSVVLRRRSRKSVATPATPASTDDVGVDISNASTPNSVRNIENIPRRRSTVISVSDEGTAVGRELEPALAYKVEKVRRSARASRILNELVIEKVDGEKSFFEVSIDESTKGCGSLNNSINLSNSKCNTPLPYSNNTSSFTPRKSNEITASSNSASSTPLTTPKSALRTRHSEAPSSGFKEPGLPLSALRPAGSQRRKTYCTPKSKTPEQMISILQKSPMVEMSRRKSRHMSSPAPKGQFFRNLITSETERLTNLSGKWTHIAETEIGLQEEVLGQIRSTVGKALLLMEQRFKQFSGLVDNYVYDLGEKKTTPTDLQGFWEMIYFQVEDVNNQFKDLEELQQSGWQVKTNTPKADKLNLKKKVTKTKPKTKGVKSNFAAFKAELQKKKAVQSSSLSTDQLFIV